MAADNDLLIFGYACKVYHDDEKARQVENALIPWMGDETITIDRYDGRGHLNSLEEFEPTNGSTADSPPLEDPDEELAESERWLSLDDDEAREEILKRAAAPVEGHYKEIGFNYEENRAETFEDKAGVENRPHDFEDPDDKPYKVPRGLSIPVTVPRPDTRREHIIIQKTASFIARQGAQIEVVIKAKQKDNPQFAFMDIEHRLNLYYRFLIQQIKSGSFRPTDTEENSDSDSDSSDSYLHPSLFAKSSVRATSTPDDLKTLFKSSTNKANCAYSQLVSKIKPNVDEKQNKSEDGDDALNTLKEFIEVMPPPPDVQPIVDKMAEYVAKNGKDFEDSIRAKEDPKFDFVKPGHEFHEYYLYKIEEFRRSAKEFPPSKPVPSADTPPGTTPVKPKSPNALERIALDNSFHDTSIENTPKIRKVEKKKLKIVIRSQEKPLPAPEGDTVAQSLIGPLLPSLYDDEDDVAIKNDVQESEIVPKRGETPDEGLDPIVAPLQDDGPSEAERSKSDAIFEIGEESPKSRDCCVEDSKQSSGKCPTSSTPDQTDEDPLKKKQLERKQKLAAFLSILKSRKNGEKVEVCKPNPIKESTPPPTPPTPPTPRLPVARDLKSTIRNLRKAVVESDEESHQRKTDASKKYSHRDKSERDGRSPNSLDRRNRKHKRRDRSRSRDSSDSDGDHRRRQRRDKRRRRSSSDSRDSSDERSCSYSSRKHHRGKSSRSRRD